MLAVPRHIAPQKAATLASRYSPTDGHDESNAAITAFVTNNGAIESEFHRAQLLRHVAAYERRAKTKTARTELERLSRYLRLAPLQQSNASTSRH